MPDDKALLTVLHISDLHFGNQPGGDSAEQMSANIPPFLAKFPHLDGLLGHHYRGISALRSFCQLILEERESDCLLIVTGDITAAGSAIQFTLADGFVSELAVGPKTPTWAEHSISGNHDQWPGNGLPLGSPTPALRQQFRLPFPVIGSPIALRNGTRIRFIFLDSDADVGPWGMTRLLARGSFTSQLKKLDEELPPIGDNEFRVLVVHHSVAEPRGHDDDDSEIEFAPGRRRPAVLEIVPRTLKVLEHTLVDHDIGVILSGHRHVARLTRLVASNGVERRLVLEARCGSTTQIDKYPYEVLERLGRNRRLAPNTLIVHDIMSGASRTTWHSQIYWRSSECRFVKHHHHVSSLLPTSLASEIVVFPRR